MVRFIMPQPGGTGRDSYIHMRDEMRLGQFYMTKASDARVKPRGGTSSLDQADRLSHTNQINNCSRLSAPSNRQLRVARQRADDHDTRSLRQLRVAMPFSAGQRLDQRDRQIREVIREDWSQLQLGSPLPRASISPHTLSPSARLGASSRQSFRTPQSSMY
mmetsp:Transcript_33033/g.64525  ORF Transcript_33033/g.64525 Transcript_33033/m.64525 type:complete len:161 (+) Transcript_33033:151-633(+)